MVSRHPVPGSEPLKSLLMKKASCEFQDIYVGLVRLHALHHTSQEPIFGSGIVSELARHGYRLGPGTLGNPRQVVLASYQCADTEATMWDDSNGEYYWIVLCKNHHYHRKQSLATGHPILLGETDSVSPPPHLETNFLVTCDDCHTEYKYNPREILRYETEPPASFSAHPLFADFGSAPITQQTGLPAPSFIPPPPRPSFSQIVRHLFHRPRGSYR
jgi:hypothetical protein